MNKINIVGGGLAGAEASWFLSKRGWTVNLYEMRPKITTPAHKTEFLAELVCSNSLRSSELSSGPGLLKREMRLLNSIIMEAADKSKVPAGGALAVNRDFFSRYITDKLKESENINIINEEYSKIDNSLTIITTGPLTSENMLTELANYTGSEFLYFYDSIAPIVDKESIDFNRAFWGNRYQKGDGEDYLNCPMTKTEYYNFINELVNGEKVPYHEFEEKKHFEGCLPIEEMAERGKDTLSFGPMKPVGLNDPANLDTPPFAVVQLRRENINGTAFNLVGFQTKLTYKEQERIFRMIPCLKNATFLRYGSMHRNSFVNAPKVLDKYLRLKNNKNTFLAGQITGVEGYIESAATGILAGIIVDSLYSRNIDPNLPPDTTAIKSLLNYLSVENKNFQPSNINFSLFPQLKNRVKGKKNKREAYSKRAVNDFDNWLENDFNN